MRKSRWAVTMVTTAWQGNTHSARELTWSSYGSSQVQTLKKKQVQIKNTSSWNSNTSFLDQMPPLTGAGVCRHHFLWVGERREVPGTGSGLLRWPYTSACPGRWRTGRWARWGGWTASRSDGTTTGSDACSTTWGWEPAGSREEREGQEGEYVKPRPSLRRCFEAANVSEKAAFVKIIVIFNQHFCSTLLCIKTSLITLRNIDSFFCLKCMFSLIYFGSKISSEPGSQSNLWCSTLRETFPCLNKDGTLFKLRQSHLHPKKKDTHSEVSYRAVQCLCTCD